MKKKIEVHCLIIGGGITGLWTMHRLHQMGISALLLEKKALGSGQTIASQGIIHSGVKYALHGMFSSLGKISQQAVEEWNHCLSGSGSIDLSSVKILSREQYLWSSGDFSSGFVHFLASRSLRSKCCKLFREQYPKIFQSDAFRGQVYSLEEKILNVPDLLNQLLQPVRRKTYQTDRGIEFIQKKNGEIDCINVMKAGSDECISIKADVYICSAGEGNGGLIEKMGGKEKMQKRPLKMTVMHFPKAVSPTQTALYGHYIGSHTLPVMTITSHDTLQQTRAWYIGGLLAEKGVNRSDAQQTEAVIETLSHAIPHMREEFCACRFLHFIIHRAENAQFGNRRPEGAFLKKRGNVWITWPTKLVFVPLVVNEIVKTMKKERQNHSLTAEDISLLENSFPHPPLAKTVW